MSPQPSSPPERPRCVASPVCSQTRSKCMYIHHKVCILYEPWSRMHGSMYPGLMTPNRRILASCRKLYPPGDPPRIPRSSPPTTDWCDATDIPRRSSGSQSIYSFSPYRCNKPPDEGCACTHWWIHLIRRNHSILLNLTGRIVPSLTHPRGRFRRHGGLWRGNNIRR